ncbi:MAG: hypothetical protein E4H02_11545 [Lentisphaerales bacterium]|jgi:hypothetical protein|nr:MAG: hypothetical protein E4H02_11545 [Lentisphaerales bacterium]
MRLPDHEKKTRRSHAGLFWLRITRLAGAALFIIVGSCSQAAVVTLQEGVHEYTGCEDSYVYYYDHAPYASVNYGANTNLLLDSQHFTPG